MGPRVNHKVQAAVRSGLPDPLSTWAGDATARLPDLWKHPHPGLGGLGMCVLPTTAKPIRGCFKGLDAGLQRGRRMHPPGPETWPRLGGGRAQTGSGQVRGMLAITGGRLRSTSSLRGWGSGGLRGRKTQPATPQRTPVTAPPAAATNQRACPSLGCPPSAHAPGPSTVTKRSGRLCHQRGQSQGQVQSERHVWDRACRTLREPTCQDRTEPRSGLQVAAAFVPPRPGQHGPHHL